jgi:hypothetical protein
MPMEDANPDLLLSCLFRRFADSAVGDVKKEVAQPGGRLQVLARGNALNQRPSGVSHHLVTDFGS